MNTIERLKRTTRVRCPSCSRVVQRDELKRCHDCHATCCGRCADDVPDGPAVRHAVVCPACSTSDQLQPEEALLP